MILAVVIEVDIFFVFVFFFFFQAEDGIRDVERSRGLGDVDKRLRVACCGMLGAAQYACLLCYAIVGTAQICLLACYAMLGAARNACLLCYAILWTPPICLPSCYALLWASPIRLSLIPL